MAKSLKLLSPGESARLREAYIEAFVNSSSDYYRTRMATLQQFRDGEHQSGYLWDTLRPGWKAITVDQFEQSLLVHDRVHVMADDHSRDRVIGAPLWPYPRNSVILIQSKVLLQCLPVLPEDLYIFDSTVKWTLIPTHEYDETGDIYLHAERKWNRAAE